MNVETKYSIGQTVWAIHDRKIYNGPVNNISVNVNFKNQVDISYTFAGGTNPATNTRSERDVFGSQEELLKGSEVKQ